MNIFTQKLDNNGPLACHITAVLSFWHFLWVIGSGWSTKKKKKQYSSIKFLGCVYGMWFEAYYHIYIGVPWTHITHSKQTLSLCRGFF